MQQFKSCIYFLVDGARPDIFEQKLKAGLLPNLSRHMIERGGYRRATTVFPSTTGPAYLPMLTGCYPGTCNVPGIRWFDRSEYGRTPLSVKRFRSYVGIESYMINKDLRPQIKTLFELSKKPINIFSSINRGVSFFGNRTKLMRIFYFYYAHLTDRWSYLDKVATRKLLRALKKKPDFVFLVYPAVDEYSHLADPFSFHTQKAYEEFDRLFGLVVKRLQELGRYDDTLLVLSSDHGLSATTKHFGVDRFLEEKGLKTFFYPLIYKRNFSAATMVSGNGMCHVYLRGNGSWKDTPTFEELRSLNGDIPKELVEREEVDLVAGRGEDEDVYVLSKKGSAKISKHNGRYFYQKDHGDPLELGDVPQEGMDSREALEKTFETKYPDSLVQLHQIFQSSRSGDFIVSANPGFDLRDRFESPEHHGSHGSLHREHMHVPLAINAPLKSGPIRTADLFPTMLSYLGMEPQENIDGVNRRG